MAGWLLVRWMDAYPQPLISLCAQCIVLGRSQTTPQEPELEDFDLGCQGKGPYSLVHSEKRRHCKKGLKG